MNYNAFTVLEIIIQASLICEDSNFETVTPRLILGPQAVFKVNKEIYWEHVWKSSSQELLCNSFWDYYAGFRGYYRFLVGEIVTLD